VPRRRVCRGVTALLALSVAACEAPKPPVPDRSYLSWRNAIDPKGPCLIQRLAAVPVEIHYGLAYVQVLVNTTPTWGILDTGSETTNLTPAIVAAAKLKIDPSQRPRHLRGLAGGFNVKRVQAKTLQVGLLKVTNPAPSAVFDFGGSNKVKIGALIGGNIIDHLDWDVDLAHGLMTSYMTRNCHDVDPMWDTKSTGLPLTRGTDQKVIPAAGLIGLALNVTIPVQFEGGSLNAVIDTGAATSYMTHAAAYKIGLTNALLEQDPFVEIHAIDDKPIKVRHHQFREFVVGEELLHNFPVNVARLFDRDEHFDMILGMDWIAKHHLWLSYTTDSLYIDSGEKKPSNWKQVPKAL
jgi:hypothetical protein